MTKLNSLGDPNLSLPHFFVRISFNSFVMVTFGVHPISGGQNPKMTPNDSHSCLISSPLSVIVIMLFFMSKRR